MRIFNKLRGTRGWITTYERVVRFRYMITSKAKERTKILAFWEKHGLEATLDAFPVKRRSLFLWAKKLKDGGGKLESLNPLSRAPKNKRKRLWDYRILEELKRLRDSHPNLGKEKIYPLLDVFCKELGLDCPKPKTIGRLIKDMGGLRLFPQKISHFGKVMKINKKKVTRKPKDFKAKYPGHCVGLDTIEEHINCTRRYVITCKDLYSRFSFAWATNSHASLAAKEFFKIFIKLFPFPVTFVLTDNGSEFKKHFAEELLRLQIKHYHTYPRTPKMNAHVERFNRTIQEEYLNYKKFILLNDIDRFNSEMMDYLIWYNTKRVHYAFANKKTPLQAMLDFDWSSLTTNSRQKCNNGWPYTRHCS
jgi:transposase InsO family protein